MRPLLALGLALASTPAPLLAQGDAVGSLPDRSVGSEHERYLRVLQVAGAVPLHPWSIRGLSPGELDRLAPRDTAHPWAVAYQPAQEASGGPRLVLIRPESRVIYNSAFPYGSNDGAVWAGRGVTTTAQAGVLARLGPISLQIQPVAFWTENREFELLPNGRSGRFVFASGRTAGNIDLPQRFGDEAYWRLDPGQTTLRLDLRGVAAGLSTANQQWGPASEHPILLGNNAPGFLHGFLGTSRPVGVGVGSIHGRLVWGRLEQSAYSLAPDSASRRFMSGIAGVFVPRGMEGLEIGLARFYHVPWPPDGIGAEHFLQPLESLVKAGLEETGFGRDNRSAPDNQLASVFARWVLPGSGLEIYGEFAREDHNWDLRDLLLEPDHLSGYALGFQKLWTLAGSRWAAVRGELLNTQISHLLHARRQSPFYVHSRARQGHTQLGQLLGSAAGLGGGGSILAVDLYHPRGRWTLDWTRVRVADQWAYRATGRVDDRGTDVMHSLAVERFVFGSRLDVVVGVRGVYELNRNFASDVFNLNASLGLRLGVGSGRGRASGA